jgi:aspartyl/asparaginyl-tRNA synthetase
MSFGDAERLVRGKETGRGLSREEELRLVALNDDLPLFVLNWPAPIKPFYTRPLPDDPSKVSLSLSEQRRV